MTTAPTPRRRVVTPEGHVTAVAPCSGEAEGLELGAEQQRAWLEEIRAGDGDERDPWERARLRA